MKIASPPSATPRSPGWSQDVAPVPYSKRLVCAVVFAIAAGLVVAVVALFYVFAMVTQICTINGGGDRSGERVSLSCRTDGCSRFEALLADTLNTSVDPCHDFKAYVSSRWLHDPSSEPDYQWRYKWDVKYAWMRMMADEIRLLSDTSTLERLMADSFGACAHRTSENAVDTRKKFKQLMRDLSVPWPETPPRDVDPFEAHLNLSIRWNIPLWFDVKMLPADNSRANKFIYIYPSAYAKFWKGEYDAITSQGSMREYVNQYIEYFYHELTPNSSGQAADICRCDAVFNFTRHVVFQLARADAEKQPVAVLGFGSLARAFGLTTERLLSLLNDYFRPKNLSFFDQEDQALVKATNTLDVVRHIITKTDASTVLSHLGWWMLQVYAPIADNRFFVQKYGSAEKAELLRPLFCETQVESSFKLLLLVTHMDVHFRSQQQRNIHDLLTSVREAALAEYKKSHLPADVKKLLTGKLRRLRINLWPRPPFQSAALLRQIYSFEYASKNTLLDYWISERRGNAALIGSSAYFEDKRLPHGNSKDTFSYDSILDTVSLSMVAVHEPFYYTNDDAFGAINYGGLGASFAMTLQEGLESDPALRTAVASHASSGAAHGSESLPWGAVTGNDTKGSPWLELGPLYLPAFRAFQSKMRGAGSLNAGRFSPAKVFFVNFCHSQTRVRASFDCNAALQAASDFVSAFDCERGSNMNP
ncbi:endothelin-converting enzyme 1-like [Rhipicephalus microplus]|uniref:endothelin-converting enzyme 1-like n=1 Tax=Rhipicephalus microplus TaxID=6941 RepID=UPI003F6A9E18